MFLFLSEQDVRGLLTMRDTLGIVEQAFGDLARGEATLLASSSHTLPQSAGMFRTLSAFLPREQMFGLKTLTGYPGRRLSGETYFVIVLFDMASGALRAVISAGELTGLRTGAASGVAAKYLARQDAQALGIVGAGAQAWYQAESLAAVREIRTAKVYSRQKPKAEALALRLSSELSIHAVAVSSPEEAVRQSDLVVAATTALSPVIEGAWLKPGTHVSGIGANTPNKQELDSTCFAQARVVADSREQVLEACGDLRRAVASFSAGRELIYAELGELVAGLKPARTSAEEITIFKSVGLAVQDVAVAAWLHTQAQAASIGTRLE